MRDQRTKDLFLLAASPALFANHLLYRWRLRRFPRDGGINGKSMWLQIGSGPRPHRRFFNVEANPVAKRDAWLDVRHGLPFEPTSVDLVYACHVFEHFSAAEIRRVLLDCRRVLRPGGSIRILVPSLEMAVNAYIKNDTQFLQVAHSSFSSLGGAFSTFVLLDGQHKLAFDLSLARELLEEAGFCGIRELSPRRSDVIPDDVLADLEPPVPYIEKSLVVEAIAP